MLSIDNCIFESSSCYSSLIYIIDCFNWECLLDSINFKKVLQINCVLITLVWYKFESFDNMKSFFKEKKECFISLALKTFHYIFDNHNWYVPLLIVPTELALFHSLPKIISDNNKCNASTNIVRWVWICYWARTKKHHWMLFWFWFKHSSSLCM